jgi:thymidine kinase
MFAGKSSAILSRVRRARTLDWDVFLVTCAIDTRYDMSGAAIMTHDKDGCSAIGVKSLEGVREMKDYKEAKLVIVEEGQFFPDLFDFVSKAVEEDGKDLVVVGLDGDSERKPFGDILKLIPHAEEVERLTAFCSLCKDGTPAVYSKCFIQKEGQVAVGAGDIYKPVCRKHYLEK